jgi:phosphate starvation-inducible PhoH-like protein
MSTSKKARKVAPAVTPSQIKINGFEPIVAKNYAQGQYLEAIRKCQITFGIGSAGTGKTYIATAYAAEQLYYKRIDKVVLTRPAVEAAGETLGFLPGELIEGKLLPYMTPYLETFSDLLGKSFLDYCLKVGYIEPVPLAFMRGRSFKNCLILADEMQSATPIQMQLLLTRIGENSKLVINGDIAQRDDKNVNGLEDASNRLGGLPEVDIIQFHDNDCVRSGLCKKVLQAYSL